MDPHSECLQFLKALWPDELPGWLLWWGSPSRRSEWTRELTAPRLSELVLPWADREDVYVGCGLRRENLGPSERGGSADVIAIPGVWADLDYGTEHKKKNLPPTEADARELLASMGLAPTLVIHSGRGLQAWWLFAEPWILETAEDRAKAEALTKGWGQTLRARAKARHWDADQVGDLARVMRMPGLWNRKRIPARTRTTDFTPERRYQPSDLDGYLIIEPERPTTTVKRSWTYTLNPGAEPPTDKFLALCENNLKFKQSWNHTRPDLQDQSTSGADQSLANYAYVAGWSVQEIVNLLIAHRRKHGKDLKLRESYFNPTLDTAASGKATEEREALLRDLESGKMDLPEEVKTDPARLFETLSDQLKVPITKFLRYKADNNSYELEVKGERIAIADIKFIESQTMFRRLILDRVDHVMPVFKPAMWRNILQRLFLCVENVDIGQQATIAGSYTQWIDTYLGHLGIMNSDRWQEAAVKGRPHKVDGEVWISREDFFQFVTSTYKEKIGLRELAGVLRKLGFENQHRSFRDAKGRVINRSFWRVPWTV